MCLASRRCSLLVSRLFCGSWKRKFFLQVHTGRLLVGRCYNGGLLINIFFNERTYQRTIFYLSLYFSFFYVTFFVFKIFFFKKILKNVIQQCSSTINHSVPPYMRNIKYYLNIKSADDRGVCGAYF